MPNCQMAKIYNIWALSPGRKKEVCSSSKTRLHFLRVKSTSNTNKGETYMRKYTTWSLIKTSTSLKPLNPDEFFQ